VQWQSNLIATIYHSQDNNVGKNRLDLTAFFRGKQGWEGPQETIRKNAPRK